MQKGASLDAIEGQNSEKEYSNDNTKESWVSLDKEQTYESENEKVPSCLPSYPPCVQENNHQKEKYLNVMVEEDMKNDPDKKVSQGNQSYIELWFQKINKM